MNFKMRVFFFKTEGVAEELMEQLSREYRVKADQIPPAYPVENEKLILVCIDDGAAKPKKALVDFCRNLDNARCQNVAFSSTSKGGVEAAKELSDIIRSNNINVVDEPHLIPVKSGLFGSKVTDESVSDVKIWAKHIIDIIHQ
ncbi:MAG: hypothetical protein PHE47_02190 [Oscillospiraceae bacterium]|nr:hypothetical protein [Oscillospiraceae bacterium]